MPQLSQVRNIEFFQKQAKKLLKHYRLHDPDAASLLQAAHPHFAGLSQEQDFTQGLRLGDAQLAIARQQGFLSWKDMTAYVEGRPRRENGQITLYEEPGWTQEEKLNHHACLNGMPPIDSVITSQHGIQWEVLNYGFFPMPAAFARYPDDCDYLPLVWPKNISERLRQFISETDHCTSKRILFIDTMPAMHPFRLGENIHYAISSSNPDESYIFLDAAHAHETTFAHEVAHLWLNYVQEGGDGMRRLRDEGWDNAKFMQLNFVQSFVVDLKVNDLIAERGFDMSLVNEDEINSLTMLRDALALGHKPPTAREALLNGLTIAGAVLEQKRWPDIEKQRLAGLLDFFEAATPGIFQLAQQLVEIVRQYGYDSREAIRKTLNECITLAFRATGDDFDLERDLEDFHPAEGMQDKYPEKLPGLPVPLKVEIGKTLARKGIRGQCQIGVSADHMGKAQIIAETAGGQKIGPLPVDYHLIPFHLTPDFQEMRRPSMIGGPIAGGAPGAPPLADPIPQVPQVPAANGQMPDQFGRLPGDPGYNTCYPPGQDPMSQIQAMQSREVKVPLDSGNPLGDRGFMGHFYMAGVGLSVARARLIQQMVRDGSNPYRYSANNPIRNSDPNGLAPTRIVPNDLGGGCQIVSEAVYAKYDCTPQHACNHLYTHCMACCEITKMADAQCARAFQLIQDLPHDSMGRLISCGTGIGIALYSGKDLDCSDYCLKSYPWPAPQPHCCPATYCGCQGSPPLAPCCDMRSEPFCREKFDCCSFLKSPKPLPEWPYG